LLKTALGIKFKKMKLFRFFKTVVQKWLDDRAFELSASLAFYAMLSFAPLVIVTLAIVGFFFGEQAARGEVVGHIDSFIGQQGAEITQTVIANTQQVGGSGLMATLISVVVLLFAATGVFMQLQRTLNDIWNVKPNPNSRVWDFFSRRLTSFFVVLGVGALVLISLAISAGLSFTINFLAINLPAQLLSAADYLTSFMIISLVFALLFKYIPDAEVKWKDVLIGSTITALLFLLGKLLIGVYMSHTATTNVYGAAGSLVALLLWIYYSSLIFFIGAEFTHVYANEYGSRIKPKGNATLKQS